MSANGPMNDITKSPLWSRLDAERDAVASTSLAAMFAADPGRTETLTQEFDGISVDLSRQRLRPETLSLLIDLAREGGVEAKRDAAFAGALVNATEGRAVLHMALRDFSGLTNADAAAEAKEQRDAIIAFADAVRDGRITGNGGARFTHAVNIGIGGSHLGPFTAATALAGADQPLEVRYVANVDGVDLSTQLMGLDPETTLFMVASKTFTTAETMANARSARDWLTSSLGEEAVAAHFCALSTNTEAAAAFGIEAERVFPFADWVGGRFSLWSSIGLSIALAVGGQAFEALLKGAHAMDRHFMEAPLDRNLPVLLAVTDLWNRVFQGLAARAVLPYDERLRMLPLHLQQLEMESNGKGVTLAGDPVAGPPGWVVFGSTGTNGQHSFHQLLHQGPEYVAAEFIGVTEPGHALAGHHEMLLASMLAQAEALAMGTIGVDDPHRRCPGNRPSTVMLLRRLDPHHLGMLLALYEHKVMAEGAIWGINSFDQFGVELGKVLAGPLLEALAHDAAPAHPASAASVARLKRWRD